MPDFTDPPVVEVALSVQFDPLEELGAPQLGLLWTKFRDRFPKVEEHLPLDPFFERFGVRGTPSPGVHLQLAAKPLATRWWFLNAGGTELVQVQKDRFVHNWRKVGTGDTYPRYESIRETFQKELAVFRGFLSDEGLGNLKPNQCEVTYVNHIVSGEGWHRHGQLGEVLTVFASRYSDTFLPEPEDGRVAIDYIIPDGAGDPIGRLHISVQPACRATDDRAILILTLTARSEPVGSDASGLLDSLDLAREWIVRGFASITTDKMHEVWGRTDVRC